MDTRPVQRRWLMRLAIWSVLVPALGLGAAQRAAAQDSHGERSAGRLIAGGSLGLLAGGGAGALLGALLYNSSCSGYCETSGIAAVAGAGLGTTIGVPLGVHLANDRRGSYPLSLLASIAIAGAGLGGIYLVETIDSDAVVTAGYVAIGVAVPLSQLGASVLIHRRARPR